MSVYVIKIGSSTITDKDGLDEGRIEGIARDCSALQDLGVKPVIVTSGAVACGKRRLNVGGRIRDITLKQAAAAVGQGSLIWAYEKAFNSLGRVAAQVLLTHGEFSDRKRYINVKNTLTTLIDFNVIPIINENDTVSVDELKFGDNDRLSALVAAMLSAKRLIILSDIDGLYTHNPAREPQDARLIPVVTEITPEIERYAGVGHTADGTGGMRSKLAAARIAMDHAISMHIINGTALNGMVDVHGGKKIGTEFIPHNRYYNARKSWIASGKRAFSSITVDEGCVDAVINKGKSVLPSGIKSLKGAFARGDAVNCLDITGRKIAKGLINYSSEELQRIIGKKTAEIEPILGYKYSDEAIHRDNMIIFK